MPALRPGEDGPFIPEPRPSADGAARRQATDYATGRPDRLARTASPTIPDMAVRRSRWLQRVGTHLGARIRVGRHGPKTPDVPSTTPRVTACLRARAPERNVGVG